MKVSAVIVTYNRIEKLKKALRCYEAQNDFLFSTIVVNNNSNDGTKEFLEEWEHKTNLNNVYILNLNENTGGSGGFYSGEQFAMTLNPDWIFVADDDAYPEERLFEKFIKYAESNNISKYGAICTKVINSYGTIALDHRCRLKISVGLKMSIEYSTESDYRGDFDINILSYVGSFLNKKALEVYGLCEKDFFIYADDVEHSLRIEKYGSIICVPSLEIKHDSGFGNQKKKKSLMSWRDYYLIRNNIFMRRKHYPITNIHYILFYCAYALSKFNIDCLVLTFTAIKDGYTSKLGRHNLYKPGFEIVRS